MGGTAVILQTFLNSSSAPNETSDGHLMAHSAGQGKRFEVQLMIRKLSLRVASGLAIFFASVSLQAAVASLETFDNGTNGFEPNTTSSTVIHQAAGGNPDGHLLIRKDLSPPAFDVGALTATRAEFLGDYAAAGITGAAVDLNFQTTGIQAAWLRFRKDASSNGWRFPLTNAFPQNVWNTYGVSFNPTWSDIDAKAAGWLTDADVDPVALPSLPFAEVMASVGTAEVRIASDVSTLVGMDNFMISVPEPSALALSSLGGLALLAGRRRR
jgi:hypothetical protein